MASTNIDSPCVQSHLTILQSVIARMASNSANCKTWCVTLVAAILVVGADGAKIRFALLALVPTLFFLLLDAYYLSLERCFRHKYDAFVENLSRDPSVASGMFVVKLNMTRAAKLRSLAESTLSVSILPFYGSLAIMIVVTWWLMHKQ